MRLGGDLPRRALEVLAADEVFEDYTLEDLERA